MLPFIQVKMGSVRWSKVISVDGKNDWVVSIMSQIMFSEGLLVLMIQYLVVIQAMK